jgi:adenylate kinase family enzyme
VKLYALVGTSGSGKSHVASSLAQEIKADFTIDDGLLIHRDTITAGFSAKFEATKVAAVKRAIFTNHHHRRQVQDAIRALNPAVGLILGTSKNMILKIRDELEIDADIEWILIEEITDSETRQKAQQRRAQGLHAIPVLQSSVAVTPTRHLQFIRNLLQHISIRQDDKLSNAATVVQPIFMNGGIYLHPRAIRSALECFIAEKHPLFEFRKLHCSTKQSTTFLVHVHTAWQSDLHLAAKRLASEMYDYVHENLGFPYPDVTIRIVSITPSPVRSY